MAKRQKTGYPGVFFKEVRRIGGKTGEKEKSYYIIFKKDGKNIEEHTGYQYRNNMTPSKAAKIRGQRIENRRQSKKDIRKAQEAEQWTFNELWTHYLSNRPEAAHSDISRFNTYIKDTIGDMKPSELKPFHLDPVHELLREKSASTKYSSLQLINRISTYGKRKMLCDPIRFFIEMPKVDIERTEQLTKEQLHRLLDVLHEDEGPVSTMMELALVTGLRKTSMLKLKWKGINFENRFIEIVNKGGRKSVIPMNKAARSLLKSLDQNAEYVLQDLQGRSGSWILHRANFLKARAGLPDDFRPFHGLRHSFASLLASEGVPLYQVSALLTHKNLQMTQRYSHLSDESKQAATEVLDDILGGVQR